MKTSKLPIGTELETSNELMETGMYAYQTWVVVAQKPYGQCMIAETTNGQQDTPYNISIPYAIRGDLTKHGKQVKR